jgi:hypothetical protein
VALLLNPATTLGAKGTVLDPALCDPATNTFSLTIDNGYFPLPVGQQWVLGGQDQGESIGLRITVLDQEERFRFGSARVQTRVIEEAEWADADGDGVIDADEELIEVSLNYFAQTQDGTVCYFGELVDIFEGGVVVSHAGAWRADDPGNAPGIFMPADPQVGMTFQQEHAPGIAQDRATITKSGATTVPAGTFAQTITTRDFNPLDGSRSTKAYAFGVGLIRDDRLELVSY